MYNTPRFVWADNEKLQKSSQSEVVLINWVSITDVLGQCICPAFKDILTLEVGPIHFPKRL
jgi:hypothetical protein